jgi:putative nucleotidyltransferase-like protein
MFRTVMLPSGIGSRSSPSGFQFDLGHLSPEGQLLVLLARTSANGTLQVEIQDRLRDRVDWDLLLQLAQTHGVAPLVYRMLMSYGRGFVPSRAMETFRRHVQMTSIVNTLLADELITLMEVFTAKGIGAIPLHGPTLALIAYGDLALRECTDLDLIVSQDSISQARRLLWSRGYQLIGAGGLHTDEQQESAYSFVKKNGMFRVNLQSAVARGLLAFNLDRQELWQGLKPVRTGQRTIMAMGAEELLIVLCVYGSTHVWKDLRLICDVAELVRRRRGLDWSRVVFLSREWRCRRLLLMGLAMAHTLLDTPLPASIRAAIAADPDIPDLAKRMPERFLRVGQEGAGSTDAEAFYLTLQDGWTRQCAFAVALCRTELPAAMKSPDWFRFHGRLHLMYRFLHPVHRATAYCAHLLGVKKLLAKRLETPG